MEEILRQAIESVIRSMRIKGIIVGQVSNVTDIDCTVSQEGLPDLENVRLNALADQTDTFFTVVPADGSVVLVGIIEDEQHDGVVLMCSDIQKIIWKIGDKTFQFDKDLMVINGGKNGGIPIANNTADRLNNLENDLNAIKQVFSSWTPVAHDGGAALKSASASWSGQQLAATQASDLENTKVKH